MPSIAPLVITDRATPTPVSHTFNPDGMPNGIAMLAERPTDGTSIGANTLGLSNRKTGTKVKGRLTLTLPIVQTETINGVSRPTIVRTAYIDLNVTFDKGASQQERDNAIGLLRSALDPAKALVFDTFVKGEEVWG